MKKLYTLLLCLVAMMLPLNALAIEFILEVSNPAELKDVSVWTAGGAEPGMKPFVVSETETRVTIDDDATMRYLYFTPVKPAKLLRYDFYNEDGERISGWSGASSQAQAVSLPLTLDGGRMVIVTGEEAVDGYVTVNLIGDPSKLRFFIGADAYSLHKGEQRVEYRTSSQKSMYVLPQGVAVLYRVTQNSKEIKPTVDQYGQYQYSIYQKVGDVITIETDFPEVYYNVTLTVPEGCEGIVEKVTVDDEPVADWKQMKVRMGSQLHLAFNVDDYAVSSFTRQGEEVSLFMGTWTAIINRDEAYTIDAVKIERPLKAHVITHEWQKVDDTILGYLGSQLSRASGKVLELGEGYNEIAFAESDNPFEFRIWTDDGVDTYVYLNNEQIVSAEGNWALNFSDGDILKAFLTTWAPELYHVRYKLIGVDAEPTIVADYVTAVDHTAGHDSLEQTHVSITPAEGVEGSIISLKVNGTEVAANDCGIFEFSIEADTEVEINGYSSGIESLGSESASDTIVYDLLGRRYDAKSQLAPGVYVKHGSKVVVR